MNGTHTWIHPANAFATTVALALTAAVSLGSSARAQQEGVHPPSGQPTPPAVEREGAEGDAAPAPEAPATAAPGEAATEAETPRGEVVPATTASEGTPDLEIAPAPGAPPAVSLAAPVLYPPHPPAQNPVGFAVDRDGALDAALRAARESAEDGRPADALGILEFASGSGYLWDRDTAAAARHGVRGLRHPDDRGDLRTAGIVTLVVGGVVAAGTGVAFLLYALFDAALRGAFGSGSADLFFEPFLGLGGAGLGVLAVGAGLFVGGGRSAEVEAFDARRDEMARRMCVPPEQRRSYDLVPAFSSCESPRRERR